MPRPVDFRENMHRYFIEMTDKLDDVTAGICGAARLSQQHNQLYGMFKWQLSNQQDRLLLKWKEVNSARPQ